MSESIDAGLKVVAQMLDERTIGLLEASVGSEAFGAKLGEFSLDFAFAKVWARPELARRERSLVTLGILIALRQTEELKIHAQAALRNGCTVKEIEEVLYQASVYAGFPAAAAASGVVGASLRQGGHIK
jgi:alkylhydroperoxidase/carboxymuconolactone decarboxylase family protein YurZ